jgi:hypothetical protein
MLTFNKEKDQVIITLNSIEEFFAIKTALYTVLQTAFSNPHGVMNADTLYFYTDLMKQMEPKIDVITLELQGIEEGGKNEN